MIRLQTAYHGQGVERGRVLTRNSTRVRGIFGDSDRWAGRLSVVEEISNMTKVAVSRLAFKQLAS